MYCCGLPARPPGVALKDLNAVGSIFLRTESGDLVERWCPLAPSNNTSG